MKKLLMLVLITILVTGLSLAGTITVNSPNGSENWVRNTVQIIKWNGYDLTNPVKLTLWRNGVFVGLIIKDQPANGTYRWNVGSYQGGMHHMEPDIKLWLENKEERISKPMISVITVLQSK